jgi:uncharacterized protein
MATDGKVLRILSIDGGGIRGIIPALMLAEIERLAGRPACELFDLIAGTSTGGIIALGVSVPDTNGGGPMWSAEQLAELYVTEGPHIFHHSLLRTIETVDGVLHEKYSASGLEKALERYMGDTLLSEALTDVLITSYDIQRHEPTFFKSFTPDPRRGAAQGGAPRQGGGSESQFSGAEYPMRFVARATSAAPTYFKPEDLLNATPSGQPPDYVLVDGGTFANNPAMCAYAEARRNHPDAEVLIVSLGTGRLTDSITYNQAKGWGLIQWAHPLLGVMMDGSSAAIDYQLDEILDFEKGHYRFQTTLTTASDSLDDASAENIAALQALARKAIEEEEGRLREVVGRL